MNPRSVWAVARRIVSQFRHDPGTVGLLIVAPPFAAGAVASTRREVA